MKIKIDIYESTTSKSLYAYALKIVSSSEADDANVFVYQRGVPSLPDGEITDTFIHVATPVDFSEIPVGKPNFDQNMPFYRTNIVTLWFRNQEDLEIAKNDICFDIGRLCKIYNELVTESTMTLVETKEFGN